MAGDVTGLAKAQAENYGRVIDLVEGVGGFVGGLFGGGGPSHDPGSRGAPTANRVKQMLRQASTSEISRLRNLYKSAYGKDYKNARLLSYDSYGGNNPNKNRTQKRKLKAYFNGLMGKYASKSSQRRPTKTGSGYTATGGDVRTTGRGSVISGVPDFVLIPGALVIGWIVYNQVK